MRTSAPPDGKRTALAGLIVIALLSALLYWQGITAQYPLAKGLLQPHATWSSLVNASLWAGGRHAGVYALLMLGYVVGLQLALRASQTQQRAAIIVIAGGWLLCSITLLPAYPGDSLDIFDYLFRGRMQVLFGVSPLAVPPLVFHNQPFYKNLTWDSWVDAYGPLWEYASGMVARTVGFVSDRRLEDYVLGYRLFAIALTGGCGVLIALVVRRQAPQRVAAALLAWLWNPLLLIATAVGAHNDGIMLVLILGAVLLFQRQHWLLGLLALGLAAHTKITALLLLPVFGLWLLRQSGWRRTLGTSGSALALIVPVSWLLYAPLGGWATLPRMLRERHILTYNSLANIAYEFLSWSHGWKVTAARQAAIQASEALFLIIAAGLLFVFWRRITAKPADNTVVWHACITLTVVYLLVGCFWFQYWYVMWALVFAALLPASRTTTMLLPCFALGALWSNLVTDFLIHDRARHFRWVQINQIMIVTLLTPAVAALLMLVLMRLPQARQFTRWVRTRLRARAA